MAEQSSISVTAFTGGLNVPSARFRVRQLIPHLSKAGVRLVEKAPLIAKYPPKSKIMRPLWLLGTTACRVPGIAHSYTSQITLLQREFVSTLVTLEKFTSRPRVLDVDDAVHIYRNGKTAKKLASYCDLALCGNTFLADWYDQQNIRTVVLPTGIDAARFTPRETKNTSDFIQIGWTGVSSNLKYLYEIEPALESVLQSRPNTKLTIICDQAPQFKNINPEKIIFHQWQASNEATLLHNFDIGIMPLSNTEWERGKCAFKILQYMSCRIPVVAAPVGVNFNILNSNNIGLAASNNNEWIDALIFYIDNQNARTKAGAAGRETVLSEYDVPIIAEKMANAFKQLLSSTSA